MHKCALERSDRAPERPKWAHSGTTEAGPRAEGLVFGRENVVSDIHFGSPRSAEEDPFARSASAALWREQTLLRICRQIGSFVRHSPAVIFTSRGWIAGMPPARTAGMLGL